MAHGMWEFKWVLFTIKHSSLACWVTLVKRSQKGGSISCRSSRLCDTMRFSYVRRPCRIQELLVYISHPIGTMDSLATRLFDKWTTRSNCINIREGRKSTSWQHITDMVSNNKCTRARWSSWVCDWLCCTIYFLWSTWPCSRQDIRYGYQQIPPWKTPKRSAPDRYMCSWYSKTPPSMPPFFDYSNRRNRWSFRQRACVWPPRGPWYRQRWWERCNRIDAMAEAWQPTSQAHQGGRCILGRWHQSCWDYYLR